MNVGGVASPGRRGSGPARRAWQGWPVPALAGAAAFWLANLAISATPVAGAYRSALGIAYLPMLLEAAIGGLALGGALAFVLVHRPAKIPGPGLLSKALLLGAAALVVLTVGIELPAKLTAGVGEPGRWLVVATVFNVIRVAALAVTIGLITGYGGRRRNAHRGWTRRETSR